MSSRRVLRLNSLLKEVISEVLREDLHHEIKEISLLAVTSVEITADLSYAKVFISVIAEQSVKEHTCAQLNRISGQIAHLAMKKVCMRIFPKLSFFLDEGLEKHMRICDVLAKVLPEG